ncbi:MAG: hypothetical protein KC619_10935 [Myxococcales bacterium]|nr:hypothetical protein [Myxococcales bacterium]
MWGQDRLAEATWALVALAALAALGVLVPPSFGGHGAVQLATVAVTAALLVGAGRVLPPLRRGGSVRALAGGLLLGLAFVAPTPLRGPSLFLTALPAITVAERMSVAARIAVSVVVAAAPWALSAVDAPAWDAAPWLGLGVGLAVLTGVARHSAAPPVEVRELRKIAERVVRHREDERARLSRELHDGTSQLVHGLRLEIEVLRQTGPASVGPSLERMEGLVGQLDASIREVLSGLRPAILDDAGLGGALLALTGDASAAAPGVEVVPDVDEALRVEDRVIAITLYRVAQEALTNAVRHARAGRIELSLRPEREGLLLAVTDDGRGIGGRTGGYGLQSIEERAALVGGDLAITSGGSGTTVRLWAPRTFEADHISSASMPIRRRPSR